MIYLIGSLRNPEVPKIAQALRAAGHDVFDDWHAVGPEADDHWKEYEQARGRSYREALKGAAAKNVYGFDLMHLDDAETAVLVMPAGKSAHLELGYCAGQGKRTYVLLPGEPEADRWDVMYQFADGVVYSVEELIGELDAYHD